MSEPLSRDLALLADLFTSGGWREIRVAFEGVSLLFSTDRETLGLDTGATPIAASGAPPAPAQSTAAAAPRAAAAPPAVAIEPAWHVVTAANLGTFYRAPKPGSPPFVELGQHVSADTEICLIEVMKLFTSVKAGVAGIVRRIDAADAELVEGGQTLFHIEPK